MSVFKDLWWFFKAEKRAYGLGILLLAFVGLLELLPPKVIGIVVDHINNNTLTGETLLKWSGTLLAMAVTVYVLRYSWRIMIFGASVRLARLLRNRLYEHFTKCHSTFIKGDD
jgi:ATP-binding cassette subfamily B multidrug efflux pump